MYTQTISVKEAREKISEIIEQVAIGKKTYIITKFGKPKVKITHLEEAPKKVGKKKRKFPGFGMWADREDMKDSAAWVAKIRSEWSKRYEPTA